MSGPIQLVSVNRAARKSLAIGEKTVETGIFKQPVFEPVAVTLTGLAGDVVADTRHHGGPDQALAAWATCGAPQIPPPGGRLSRRPYRSGPWPAWHPQFAGPGTSRPEA